MSGIVMPSKTTLSMRQHPSLAGRIVLLMNGQFLCDMPWQAADELARGLVQSARMAENLEAAPQQVLDQAVLLRAGLPVGLNSDKRVFNEAVKEAVHNRELRKSNLKLAEELPVTRESFGIPTVKS